MICFCKISNRTISKPFKIITWDFEDTLPLFSGTWLFVPLCRPPHYWSVSGGIASNKCTGPCEYIVTTDHLVAGTPGQVWCWTWPIQQAAVVCVWFVIYVSPSVSTQFMRVWISCTTAIYEGKERESFQINHNKNHSTAAVRIGFVRRFRVELTTVELPKRTLARMRYPMQTISVETWAIFGQLKLQQL